MGFEDVIDCGIMELIIELKQFAVKSRTVPGLGRLQLKIPARVSVLEWYKEPKRTE